MFKLKLYQKNSSVVSAKHVKMDARFRIKDKNIQDPDLKLLRKSKKCGTPSQRGQSLLQPKLFHALLVNVSDKNLALQRLAIILS